MKSVRIVSIAAALVAVLSAACGQTDAGITTAVKTKLAADDDVKAYQIDVDTNNKVVTLSGTVDTPTAKARAVEIAKATDGVVNVVDNVMVSDATAATPTPSDVDRAMYSDTALTAAVKGKLMADTAVAGLRIDVDTLDGVVTLTGQVRSPTEKEQALKLARETNGVKSVIDRLTVAP
jgi:hyperosmotically inducible periplasmic protein